MFGTVIERYRYLEAIDRAMNTVASGQLGLPSPDSLAKAFNILPYRPEVPFMLMRAARLLSFDDMPQMYGEYIEDFMLNVEKEEIATKFKDFRRSSKFSIDADDHTLPTLDPIELLTTFSIEGKAAKEGLKWSVGILKKYRDRDEDVELKVWRQILEMEFMLADKPEISKIDHARTSAIANIEGLTEPQRTGSGFRSLSFVADHIYQGGFRLYGVASCWRSRDRARPTS